MIHISTRVERIIAGLVLGISFLVMASIIVPHDTQATPSDHADNHDDAPHRPTSTPHAPSIHPGSTDPHEGLAQLGSIESTCYLVHIYAGETHPLYTVIDITDGRALGTLLTAEQVEARFPELPITKMDFGTNEDTIGPRVIMHAETDDPHDFQ